MTDDKPVWKQRWEKLRTRGFSYEQALEVHRLLNEVFAYRTDWMAERSFKYLDEVYGR